MVAMPRPAAQVTISVKTEPADAEIEQDGPDGKALHKAPYTFMVKKDSGEVSLKIRAAGYQEESRVLHPSEDQNIEITLAKQEKPVEPATVDTGSTPKTKPEVAVKEPKEGKPVKEPKEVAGARTHRCGNRLAQFEHVFHNHGANLIVGCAEHVVNAISRFRQRKADGHKAGAGARRVNAHPSDDRTRRSILRGSGTVERHRK